MLLSRYISSALITQTQPHKRSHITASTLIQFNATTLVTQTHKRSHSLTFGVGKTWAAFRVCLRVDSEVPPRRLLAQSAFRVCLRGAFEASPTSERRKRRQKGSSKMAAGSTNQNCSFDYKWQPPYRGAAILKNLFSQSELFF